jgi:hypothetical protein
VRYHDTSAERRPYLGEPRTLLPTASHANGTATPRRPLAPFGTPSAADLPSTCESSDYLYFTATGRWPDDS